MTTMTSPSKDGTNRPNVLLLVTDDQGGWAMGSRMPELHTPALDQLQREGKSFTQFFCASPVCSPARASIATGRMPSAHGVHDWLRPSSLARAESLQRPFAPEFLETMTGSDSIAGALSRHGYDCGMVGKWHIGSSDRPAKGFNYWYAHQLGGGPYYNAPIWEQDDATGVPHVPARASTEPEYLTDAITRQGIDFLQRNSRSAPRKPFFLQVNWTAPHDPWFNNHPKELLDIYADTNFPSIPEPEFHPWFKRDIFAEALADRHGALSGYCAAISGVDRSIAALLAKLDDIGTLDDTIIIFTSDNGFSCGHHGIWGKGNATSPVNFWEPSITVPFIVRWPGVVDAGAIDEQPASATSIIETIADLTGSELIDDKRRAGRSLASRVQGNGALLPAAPVVIHDEYGANRMIRTERWKLVVRRYGPTELYDLLLDPNETTNLATDETHKGRMEALAEAMTSWFVEHETLALSGWHVDVDGNGQATPIG